MAQIDSQPGPLYEIIGIGFGPANIAIAGAILEKRGILSTTKVIGSYMSI